MNKNKEIKMEEKLSKDKTKESYANINKPSLNLKNAKKKMERIQQDKKLDNK